MADKDNKVVGFEFKILGLTNEEMELQKVATNMKAINKEIQDINKAVKNQNGLASHDQNQRLAILNKELGIAKTNHKDLEVQIKSVEGSVTRMKARLAELTEQYNNGSAALREKLLPEMNKYQAEISKAEQAHGVFSRNVGNYANSIKKVFMELVTGGVVIAAATKLFEGMKEAIMSTTFAIDAMNTVTAVSKQIFYDLAINQQINIDKIKTAIEVQDELNKLRVQQGFDVLELSKINREEQAVREESMDRTKTHTERLELLNKVIELESQKTKIKVNDLKEELSAKEKLFKQNTADEDLFLEILAIKAKINDTYAAEDQAMRRVSSQRTGFIKEEHDRRVNELAEIFKVAIEEEKIEEEKQKKLKALREAAALEEAAFELNVKKQKDGLKYTAAGTSDIYPEIANEIKIQEEKDMLWEEGMRKARENFEANKVQMEKQAADEVEIKLNALDQKHEIAQAEMMLAEGLGQTLQNLAGKNKAVALSGLAIEKASAIAQVVSNVAIANAKALAMFPITAGQPWIAINTGMGALSIANIVGESIKQGKEISKYEGGGKANKGVPIYIPGSKDNLLIAVNETEAIINQKQIARLGGSGAMRRAGVPGFEAGGYAGLQAPYIPPSASSVNTDQFDKLLNAFNARIDRLEIHNDINKVRSSLNELEIINTPQKI